MQIIYFISLFFATIPPIPAITPPTLLPLNLIHSLYIYLIFDIKRVGVPLVLPNCAQL